MQFSIPVYGGSLNNVTVIDLNVNRTNGQVFIRTSTNPADQIKVSCHEDPNWNFTFIMSSDIDKAVYSTLLTAFSTAKLVNIVGMDGCTSSGYTKVEEVRWVTIRN